MSIMLAVYYHYVDARKQNVNLVSSKIGLLKNRKEQISRIPKIRVDVKTLKTSGLPESAFSTLPEVPLVLTVDHAEGETAQQITIRISSEMPISRIIPNDSIDLFDYQIDKSRHSAVFNIPQLRKESSIRATIMQRGLGEIKESIRIGVGKLAEVEDTKLRKFTAAVFSSGLVGRWSQQQGVLPVTRTS